MCQKEVRIKFQESKVEKINQQQNIYWSLLCVWHVWHESWTLIAHRLMVKREINIQLPKESAS